MASRGYRSITFPGFRPRRGGGELRFSRATPAEFRAISNLNTAEVLVGLHFQAEVPPAEICEKTCFKTRLLAFKAWVSTASSTGPSALPGSQDW